MGPSQWGRRGPQDVRTAGEASVRSPDANDRRIQRESWRLLLQEARPVGCPLCSEDTGPSSWGRHQATEVAGGSWQPRSKSGYV